MQSLKKLARQLKKEADDLSWVPAGIWLVLKLIPPEVLAECREQAESEINQEKPTNWMAAGIIVAIWVLLGILAVICMGRILKG